MPSADPVASTETDHDRGREREHDREHDKLERGEKPGLKQRSSSTTAKGMRLSYSGITVLDELASFSLTS
jgi:hypothetical protein